MANTHVIRRQLLDVELAGTEADGFIMQQRLADLSRDWLIPALDKVLEQLVPANEYWVVDRVFVDAGTVAAADLERGIVEAVSKALERCLRERAPPSVPRAKAAPGDHSARSTPANFSSSSINARAPAESLREAFVHFLRTGMLPWWFSLPPGKNLEECLRDALRVGTETAESPEHFAHSIRLALRTAWPRRRLVRQFPADILAVLLRGLSETNEHVVRGVFEKLGETVAGDLRELPEHVWERAFDFAVRREPITPDLLIAEAFVAWASETTPDSSAEERIEKLWPGVTSAARAARANVPARSADHREADDSSTQLELKEGQFINCAGIVLLHPFLPRFFEVLGMVREGALVQPERALALLHFLATGQREAPEHDLLLAKLLCDVPVGMPVRSRADLTAAEEEEASGLLNAVIRHWDALGETSIDALRGSFLVRPGKLSRRGDADVLQVEARAYDILLDRLPWGIGLIQLPWMKNPLWVEWRF